MQLGWLTADAADINDDVMDVFEDRLRDRAIVWPARQRRIYSLPHVVNASVQKVLAYIEDDEAGTRGVGPNFDNSLDGLDLWERDKADDEDLAAETDLDRSSRWKQQTYEQAIAARPLRRLRALIRWIHGEDRLAHRRGPNDVRHNRATNVPTPLRDLPLDCRSTWTTTCVMLDKALSLRAVR